MTQEYRESLAEVNEILKYSSIEVIKKIPYRFRRYLIRNMDKEKNVKLKENKPLTEQEISEQAKNIVALIYRDYLVTSRERDSYISREVEMRKQKELKKQKKYNPDNLFENRKKRNIQRCITENKLPAIVKEKNEFIKFFKKIICKIFR